MSEVWRVSLTTWMDFSPIFLAMGIFCRERGEWFVFETCEIASKCASDSA